MKISTKRFGMNLFFTISTIVTYVCLSSAAFAHYVSVTADDYTPAPGEEVTVTIGWGHKFPGDGQMRREGYDNTNLEIIDSRGKRQTVAIIPEAEQGNRPIKIKLKDKGVYTIRLAQKNFSTKTIDGYKYQPRNKLKNVIHSRWNETVSKAVVIAGGAGKDFRCADTSDRFQITPVENPLKLKKGDVLPVRVTLDGKPWQGMVYATYAGFSDMGDTFAYTTKTDKNGVAKIKILEKGFWLVKAEHSYPYEKKEEADEYSLKATLTFKN